MISNTFQCQGARRLRPRRAAARRHLVAPLALLAGTAVLGAGLAACGAPGGQPTGGNPRVVQVAAAENFWGSIASQLGGAHAHVVSIISNPNTDPHSYEATPADARAIASAQLVIENGIGYDPWVAQLVAANGGAQSVLDVGRLLKVPDGGNPHRWYNPVDVEHVVAAITGDLQALDPADRSYFAARAAHFESVSLAPYHHLISEIRSRYGGTPVGASESIFSMLAPALDLRVVTPGTFLRAVSEGGEVSASDVSTIDHQIARHLIRIYVYNRQNATPAVQSQLAACRAQHIPTATITETLAPATDTYQQWQSAQLAGILGALQRSGAA